MNLNTHNLLGSEWVENVVDKICILSMGKAEKKLTALTEECGISLVSSGKGYRRPNTSKPTIQPRLLLEPSHLDWRHCQIQIHYPTNLLQIFTARSHP